MTASGQQSADERQMSYNKILSLMLLAFFIFGYWLFVWQFERIDYSSNPPNWWGIIVGGFPLFQILEPLVLTLVELLSPRVLRHLIPLILGGLVARFAVSRFLESFYNLPDQSAARSYLSRLLSWGIPGRSLGVVNHETFEQALIGNQQLRVGGPGYAQVEPGTVVVTELNGRFSRVLGPGTHALERFEHPTAAIDIRPQEREAENVKMVTSDGIDLTATITVTFQIDRGGRHPTRQQQFPFDPAAVKKAAYIVTKLNDDRLLKWDTITLLMIAGELRTLVGDSRLDELIHSEGSGIHPHPRLKREMERRANKIMRTFGVQIRGARLGRFELPDPVVQQIINYWQLKWDMQRRNSKAESGNALESVAQTRAEIVRTIAEWSGLAEVENNPIHDKQTLAIRCIDALTALASMQQGQSDQAESQLETLANLRNQLQA